MRSLGGSYQCWSVVVSSVVARLVAARFAGSNSSSRTTLKSNSDSRSIVRDRCIPPHPTPPHVCVTRSLLLRLLLLTQAGVDASCYYLRAGGETAMAEVSPTVVEQVIPG